VSTPLGKRRHTEDTPALAGRVYALGNISYLLPAGRKRECLRSYTLSVSNCQAFPAFPAFHGPAAIRLGPAGSWRCACCSSTVLEVRLLLLYSESKPLLLGCSEEHVDHGTCIQPLAPHLQRHTNADTDTDKDIHTWGLGFRV
jgi:hypothetical protein